MPFGLLKYGFSRKYPAERHLPWPGDLKPSYDVVIIGGGGHGVATAYYLARDYGITSVAVIEKGYLAGGNTARNTAIIHLRHRSAAAPLFRGSSRADFGSEDERHCHPGRSRQGTRLPHPGRQCLCRIALALHP